LPLLHLAQVHAGAEGRPGAPHHHHADLAPGVQRVEGVAQGAQERRVHRVALLRPVQRDGGDARVDAREDLVGHGLLWWFEGHVTGPSRALSNLGPRGERARRPGNSRGRRWYDRPRILERQEPVMPLFAGFTLPDELRRLRDQVGRFVREEILPLERELDPDAPDIPPEAFRRLSAKTRAAGLWALGAPEEYGGGGLDTFSMCVVLEEMAQHRM